MTIRLAVNGYGRIGRNIVRALYEAKRNGEFSIVGINDLGDVNTLAHLTKYDSVHGRFPGDVTVDGNQLCIDHDRIPVFAERDPQQLPWHKLDVDLVLECTGLFVTRDKAMAHITAGAKKVLISAPGVDVDATVVYGVNDAILRKEHIIVSNASCTTNCLAHVAKVLHATVGIEYGLMNTIHAYTNDQVLTDVYHVDLHRARSATQSMIPTKTGAAKAIGLVLPELAGKLDGFALRVPVINVSVLDLTFTARTKATVELINAGMQAASKEIPSLLGYNTEALVSVDFNHNSCSAIFDATQTKVLGNVVKVLAWYDNECGFSNRMLDTASAMMRSS